MVKPSPTPEEALQKRLRDVESANQALRQREEQLNALISRAVIGIAEVDLSGRYHLVNPAFCDIVGRPMNEILSLRSKELLHPEDWPAQEAFLQNAHKSAGVRTFEARIIKPDLSFVWTRSRFSLLTDADGRPRGAAVLIEDISHERLTESERILHQLIENLDQVIWMFDPFTPKVLYVSESYEKVWELTRQSLYDDPESFMSVVCPDDLETVKQAYEKQKRGIPTDIEYRLRRRDGEIRWVSDRGFPIKNARGHIYRVAGIAEDISVRKNAEKALRESDEKYRRLVETTNEGIWIIDAKGRTVYANHHTATMLGYTLEELMEKSAHELLRESDHDSVQAQIRDKSRGLKSQGEWRLQTKNSGELWVIYCSNPIFDEKGQFSGAMVMMMNITEFKKTEMALREKLNQSERVFDPAESRH